MSSLRGSSGFRVILKQQAKRQQSHSACLHAVEKYEKVKNVNTQ